MDQQDAPSSVRQFLRALCARWFIAMSGPLAVPLGIFAVFVGNSVAKVGLAATALICLTFSAYWVWSIEREKVRFLQTRVRQHEAQEKHTAAIEAQTEELRRSRELHEFESNPITRIALEAKTQSIRDAIASKVNREIERVPVLSISLAHSDEYETEQHLPDGRIDNGAYVLVRNISSAKMQNVEIYMERSCDGTFSGSGLLPLFEGSIEIDAYGQHLVRVAHRLETPDELDLNRSGSWIILSCPASLGEQRMSQYGAYFRLKAVCSGCDPATLAVHISVGDGGRLNITEVR